MTMLGLDLLNLQGQEGRRLLRQEMPARPRRVLNTA